jgi:hypothetical protein
MSDTCPLFSALQVPLLTIAQVSHYNPQVADWTKEVIEVENQHKREARLLLFVVNGQTRSIASLIELAGTAALSGTQLSINCRNRRMYECTNIFRLLSPSFAFFRLLSPSFAFRRTDHEGSQGRAGRGRHRRGNDDRRGRGHCTCCVGVLVVHGGCVRVVTVLVVGDAGCPRCVTWNTDPNSLTQEYIFMVVLV